MANATERAPRVEEERRERRRRDSGTLDRTSRLTLTVPDHIREENPGSTFRWINDDRNRMYAKTQLDDWDRIYGVDPITVGTTREGEPMKAYLCKKPLDLHAEDEAAKMADIKEQEQGMLQGARDNASKSDLPDSAAYLPEGKNSINRL
ncbi:MAG: hypothetical protein JWR80_9484 [Bradyrhizobium sp.]|nr:hypothetical protein [Bradyrhizobium sp.]